MHLQIQWLHSVHQSIIPLSQSAAIPTSDPSLETSFEFHLKLNLNITAKKSIPWVFQPSHPEVSVSTHGLSTTFAR